MKKQTKKKLRNNGRTLRLHTKKQPKKYWGTKRKAKAMDQQGVVGVSRKRKLLKNNIEQIKTDRIKRNHMDKYRCKDKEV